MTKPKKLGWKRGLWLCLGGIGVNLVGIILAKIFHLPYYFDGLGTILTAVAGGYLPGAVTGFFTNMIGAVVDRNVIYYGSLNVALAMSAAFFYRKGAYKKIATSLATIPAFTLIGALMGSGLSWVIGSFSWAKSGTEMPLRSQILLGLADKAVTVLILLMLLHFLPEKLSSRFPLFGEKAQPESAGKRTGRSLRRKAALLISAATVFTAVGAITISVFLYYQNTIDEQSSLGSAIAKVEAGLIDPERVDDFIRKGKSAEGYMETQNSLESLRASNPSLLYMYVYQIRYDGCHVVFDLDTEDEPGARPGEIISFDDSFKPYLGALTEGKPIDPLITNDSYGWLLTVYEPVYNSQGECVCYVGLDISMNKLVMDEISLLAKAASLFIGFFFLILVISMHAATSGIVTPVNAMADAAGSFAYNTERSRGEILERIRGLDIRTGDEIENLFHALAKTTEDTVRYITDAQEQAAQVQKLQNGLILVLADLVESRDKCTGDHVRKTAAYVNIIAKQMKADGCYPDMVDDDFIENVTNSAPLHDVGKIQVPDAILNKPGKLTEEEFELMKTHTTAGSEIISHAMNTVGWRSGYLAEARNMAHYHHEKWDGSGYPMALKGESIPLSARIMAVADVFDALVSRRSYKEPFPIEKAMEIIREGSGSHFDPKVVASFFHAEAEIRLVAASHITDTYCTVPETPDDR